MLTGHRSQQPLFANFVLPFEEQPLAKPVVPETTSGDSILAILIGPPPTWCGCWVQYLNPRLEPLWNLAQASLKMFLGSKVGPDEPLAAAGLDSLGATDLRKVNAERFGAFMPATLAFDFPTVRALAPFVAQRAALADQAAAPAGQNQGQHLPSASAETAVQVLHITLDVLADVLGSVIHPDTPLMEVMAPCLPRPSAQPCMPKAQSALLSIAQPKLS